MDEGKVYFSKGIIKRLVVQNNKIHLDASHYVVAYKASVSSSIVVVAVVLITITSSLAFSLHKDEKGSYMGKYVVLVYT